MAQTARAAVKIVVAAIANDAEVQAFCETNFGKGHHVQVGWDESRLPRITDCPLIIVKLGSRTRDESLSFRRNILTVGVMIALATNPQAPESDIVTVGNVTTYTGTDLADELADLVESKVQRALMGADYSATPEPGADDDIMHPFYLAQWCYRLRCGNQLPLL